ncbi:uncharacterized protein BDV17DRAFT_72113 [Aspergillus undulatus]|uniref:uncharacterized protein n=1 Tax=Aspergillus undulatus TaxID=1810928 RepID=UPI003CCE2C95
MNTAQKRSSDRHGLDWLAFIAIKEARNETVSMVKRGWILSRCTIWQVSGLNCHYGLAWHFKVICMKRRVSSAISIDALIATRLGASSSVGRIYRRYLELCRAGIAICRWQWGGRLVMLCPEDTRARELVGYQVINLGRDDEQDSLFGLRVTRWRQMSRIALVEGADWMLVGHLSRVAGSLAVMRCFVSSRVD